MSESSIHRRREQQKTKLTVRIEQTLFALHSSVALDNANSYQQYQQTELGHAIFRIDSSWGKSKIDRLAYTHSRCDFFLSLVNNNMFRVSSLILSF